jgi:D-aspartate ligase
VDTAFVLSGQTAGLGVIRALGVHGVNLTVGYHDPGEMGRQSKYVQRQIHLPDPEEHEQEFISQLMEDPGAAPDTVLIPTSDATLAAVSRFKALLQTRYRVACPDWKQTEIFLDKKYTATQAEKAGVPAPKTLLPHCLEEIEEIAPDLVYPCLAKPSISHRYRQHFDRKMTWIENQEDLVRAYREAADAHVELMIQEYIPGEDDLGANYNAYYWDGVPLCEFTAQKVRNAPPRLGSPCVNISATIPEVIDLGRKLLGSVGYCGFACTEFKRDLRDGGYKLIEVNARHNLSSLLAVHCGMNFPWLEFEHLTHGIVPQAQTYRTGVYWIDIARDGRSWAGRIGQGLSLAQFFRPYFSPHVFAIADWRDPSPALLKTQNILQWAFSRNGKIH